MTEHSPLSPVLLAVDAGLTCGFAAFTIMPPQLLWYRSHNYGAMPRLRRGAATLIAETPGICAIIVEGGGLIADAWLKAARYRGIAIECVTAEHWRADMLLPRQQRSGSVAKKNAQQVARQTIKDRARSQSKALRDDTAEAILLGEWALERFAEIFPTALQSQKGECDDFSA